MIVLDILIRIMIIGMGLYTILQTIKTFKELWEEMKLNISIIRELKKDIIQKIHY